MLLSSRVFYEFILLFNKGLALLISFRLLQSSVTCINLNAFRCWFIGFHLVALVTFLKHHLLLFLYLLIIFLIHFDFISRQHNPLNINRQILTCLPIITMCFYLIWLVSFMILSGFTEMFQIILRSFRGQTKLCI